MNIKIVASMVTLIVGLTSSLLGETDIAKNFGFVDGSQAVQTSGEYEAGYDTILKNDDQDPEKFRANGYTANGRELESGSDFMFTNTTSSSPFISGTYYHGSDFDSRPVHHGIDVSKWQGNITQTEWNSAKNQGVEFAIIRAGYRSTSNVSNPAMAEDPYYGSNFARAKAAGIKVGIYFFSQATNASEAQAEANKAIAIIKKYETTSKQVDLPVIMDFERSGTRFNNWLSGASKSQADVVINKFMDTVSAAGYHPMVYANYSTMAKEFNYKNIRGDLWLAYYGTTPELWSTGSYVDRYNASDVWQYTSSGKVAVSSGSVDCNFWYGDTAGTYFGKKSLEDTSKVSVSAPANQTYTGSPITPSVTVQEYQGKNSNGRTYSRTLAKDKAYTLSYSNNTKPGRASLTVTGINGFTGNKPVYFNIVGKLADFSGTVHLSTDANGGTAAYTGQAVTPTVTIDGLTEDADDLVEGTDFTVSYSNNVEAGKATVNITGKGYYSGTITKTFNIQRDFTGDSGMKAKIQPIYNQGYTGLPITPDVKITGLTEGTDYTVISYSENNTEITSDDNPVVVTIEGKAPYYKGAMTTTFNIRENINRNINDMTIGGFACSENLDRYMHTYTGDEIKPSVEILNLTSGNPGEAGTDFFVTYRNNINAGTATATANGNSDWGGTVTKNYSIIPAAAASCTAKLSTTRYTYNGSVKTPKVYTYFNGKKLTNGTDYTVSYPSGRKSVGKYAVKITYKGNYSGYKYLYFTINPGTTYIKSMYAGRGYLVVNYKKRYYTGYQIKYSKYSSMSGAKYKTVKSYKQISKTIKHLSRHKRYYVKVRTYKTVNGTKYYSYWSAKKYKTTK